MSNDHSDPDERDATDTERTDETAHSQRLTNAEESLDTDALEAVLESDVLSEGAAEELRALVESAETEDPTAPIDVDTVFELLAAPGNRFVLTYLLREDNPASYSKLVEYVVTRAETPPDLTEAKFRGRIAARLVHWNLPRLEDAGLVEHDTEEHLVTATPAIDVVAPYLALAISQSGTGDENR